MSDEDQWDKCHFDLFSLKILVLLVSKDTTQMKAKLLTELVLNCEDKKIRIDNKRLIRATKFMIFFSYFLPKVF